MHRPVLCTIIAKNYLAAARTLCASFREYHPEGRCYVLVIDDHAGFIDSGAEAFEIVSLADIPLPEPRSRFCFKYAVTELATAVKPFFLRWLFETRGEAAALYLDPDILVTAPLDPLYARLYDGGGLLLTPHLDTEYPNDGLLPDDLHIMQAGVFNLGFLGLRGGAPAAKFLPWIEGKLTNRCIIDHKNGLFVDQKFFDLAPSLFTDLCDVEHGPGYNVAYWNLHSRLLSPAADGKPGRWLCNGQPLRFFHFSGYKPGRPEAISVQLTRYQLKDRPDLQAIFSHYQAELSRHGHIVTQRWPYTFNFFRNGQPIPYQVRQYYRRWMLTHPDIDPFTSGHLRRASIVLETLSRTRSFARSARARLSSKLRLLS